MTNTADDNDDEYDNKDIDDGKDNYYRLKHESPSFNLALIFRASGFSVVLCIFKDYASQTSITTTTTTIAIEYGLVAQ